MIHMSIGANDQNKTHRSLENDYKFLNACLPIRMSSVALSKKKKEIL